MASPAIVNSNSIANGSGAANSSSASHERKSSVNIASAASSQMPNGGAAPASNRLSINFGQMATGGAPSPAIAHGTSQQSSAQLSAPRENPRITSPTSSPSPIPTPTTSGGRPPSTLPAQGNGLSFIAGGDSDPNRQGSNGPHGTPVMTTPQHLRRTSSQSQHSDMGMGGPPSAGRGGFIPGAGRGRNFGAYPHQPQMNYSPQQSYRQMPNQPPRPQPGVPPHFQNQMHMGNPMGSPHQVPRSPAMPGSQPHTPHMQQMQMNGQYMPNYNQFTAQMQPGPNQFAPQPQYDPNFNYYGNPYPMHPTYLGPGPPPSPRTLSQMPPGGRPSFGQGQFQQPPSTAMSRTSSAMSERPSSSIGHPSQSVTPGLSQPSHTPSQSASSIVPPPASNQFVRPNREKKAIVIKNADGEILDFGKQKASAAKAPSPAPPSTSTPPPRPESNTSHRRTESKPGKTAEEVKAEFQEKVRRNQQGEKSVEETAKPEEPAPSASNTETTAPTTVDVKPAAESEPTKSEEKPAAVEEPSASSGETEEQRKKRLEDEEFERMVAEMEAEEKAREAEEAEREKTYKEKKQREATEKAAREKEEAANADEEMKRAEREAEAAEEAREKKKATDAESEALFAKLKRPTLGPGAEGGDSGAETPASEASPQPAAAKPVSKPKPAPLKVETNKTVEPPQPTPGMQALRSARLLQLQSDAASIYPDGIKSPNPAINQGTKRAGRIYDRDFLLQFQAVFKEKPVVDWDQKLKDTLGDGNEPKSARTPSSMGKGRGGPPPGGFSMGNFAQTQRTIPPGTTSDQRFAASSGGRPISGPLNFGGNRPPSFGNMGQMQQGRVPSAVPGGMRTASNRQPSRNESRRGNAPSRKEQESANKSMPLTAGQAVKGLEQSGSGWKPTSIGRPAAATAEAGAQLTPDLVQRKVKAALNKMTPERFDKLSEEILRIAAQSKNESDGRTLRQVIALTFEKACDESHWASMYAKFCQRMLSDMTNDVKDDNVLDKNGEPVVGGALFRKYLLNRCQEEFERGWVTNLPEKGDGQTEEAVMLSDEYYIAEAIKRKGLGLVQFIGELYKLQMLSIKIMHECFLRLLSFEGIPDESMIEALVKLLRTVGETMEKAGPQGQALVNMYFERIEKVMGMEGLPSRGHFMLLDMLDLRKSGWKTKGDKGPKTIQQIHAEAEAAQQAAELEKQRQNSRRPAAGRGDARGYSNGPMPPPDTRNIVGADEFRKLRDRGNARTASGAGSGAPGGRLGGLGPRTASGRLGPPGVFSRNSDSGSSSRRDSQKGKEDEDKSKTSVNAFDALANLDDDSKSPAASPPVTKAQPAVAEGKQDDKAE